MMQNLDLLDWSLLAGAVVYFGLVVLRRFELSVQRAPCSANIIIGTAGWCRAWLRRCRADEPVNAWRYAASSCASLAEVCYLILARSSLAMS